MIINGTRSRRIGLLLAAAGMVLGACGGPDPAVPQGPAPAAAVPSPAGGGYAEACRRAVRAGADWMDLVTRAVEAVDAASVPRAEVEAMILTLAEVTPTLPPEVQPQVRPMVEPLVQLRGLQLTGAAGNVDYAPGRDAMWQLIVLCGPHIPAVGQ